MVYYGMNTLTCQVMHFKKWQPFNGTEFWCPICEQLRKTGKETLSDVGGALNPLRYGRSYKRYDS